MSDQIITIVDTICNDASFSSTEAKIEFYVKKYPDEADKYPMLIKSACDPTFDRVKLSWMINILKKIGTNELTQHDASVQVGEGLVNEYVKPILPKMGREGTV